MRYVTCWIVEFVCRFLNECVCALLVIGMAAIGEPRSIGLDFVAKHRWPKGGVK